MTWQTSRIWGDRMFKRNDDLSIYVTRGDCCAFDVPAVIDGEQTQFKAGDLVRFKITKKKDCETVVCQRDFLVSDDCDSIEISLSGDDTRIGSVISKPADYWYEVEVNPDTNPKTIIGYDTKGAKIFKLFPEGADVNAEDIEVVGKQTLQDLVDMALQQAKESGEFKGEKGDPGTDGTDATDEQIKSAVEEYMEENQIGTSGADWNQNDSTQPDYVKNRPFYTGDATVETEICDIHAMSKTALALWKPNDGLMTNGFATKESEAFIFDGIIEVGKRYVIVANGTRRTPVVEDGSNWNSPGTKMLGDVEAFASGDIAHLEMLLIIADAAEVLQDPSYDGKSIIYLAAFAGNAAPTEFKLYSREEEIIKLDPKYLPELPEYISKPTKKVRLNFLSGRSSMTPTEIVNAVNLGFDVIFTDTIDNSCRWWDISGDSIGLIASEDGSPVLYEIDSSGKLLRVNGLELSGGGSSGTGITAEEKTLILSLFRNATYTSDMSETFAQLEELWTGDEENEVTLTSISATYGGGAVPVGMPVATLTGIVVFAIYSDGTSEFVTDYTLSGQINEGSNTITVSYGGMTDTFTVTGATDVSWTTMIIPVEDLHSGYQLKSVYHESEDAYAYPHSTRTSYVSFIYCEAGATYKFKWEGAEGLQICIEAYPTVVMEKVKDRMEYEQSYRYSSGWGDTQVSGCKFTIPETFQGYPIVAMRFTFNSATAPTGDVTITKVVL